jgi:hypothetical protein
MALLEDALDAHGGIDRWRHLQRFTLHISIDGPLIARKGKAGTLNEVVAEGSTETQSVRISGIAGPDRRYAYRPDRVAIEAPDGTELAARTDPRPAFLGHGDDEVWDDLDFAYFSGLVIWNHVSAPFLLAGSDFQTEELEPWRGQGETWRRLRAVFPPRIATYAPEQVFYFDRNGMQRRLDYWALSMTGVRIAQYASAYQSFSGVVVPTLRRSFRLGPNGELIKKPEIINIEIFDASFE